MAPLLRATSAPTGAATAAAAAEPMPASLRNLRRFIACIASALLNVGSAEVGEIAEVVGVGTNKVGRDVAVGDERERNVDYVVGQFAAIQKAARVRIVVRQDVKEQDLGDPRRLCHRVAERPQRLLEALKERDSRPDRRVRCRLGGVALNRFLSLPWLNTVLMAGRPIWSSCPSLSTVSP